ncbi:MAG TPA: tetratricopeptide repeat protein [Kofleriaceae bacterium]|jgi:TolA-binding protein|nr:tetratricopeptide repeat protein [Kofleriaceae bacterium]
MRRFVLVVATVTACSASPPMTELTTAERREAAGDIDGAIAAYRDAQGKCGALRPPRRARAACADALLGEAEVLEHAERTQEAITTYLAIPARVPDDAATAAVATFRAGELLLRAGDATQAWTALWRVVTDWPDEAPAADALRRLLEDGRGRDARALADQIANVLTALAQTGVADNLVWSLADLTEHELGNPAAARALYDRIPVEYPKSGLRDDARWHGARISRALGDPQGAVTRLRGLLATREVAFGAGSYFSVWLDNAQLELGRVLRDDLGDLRGAIAAFEQLPKHYPASILRDDALYELALTQARAGDPKAACASRAQLVRQSPDSKYVPRLQELGCD